MIGDFFFFFKKKPILSSNLQITSTSKQLRAITRSNHSWSSIKILLIQSHMILIDGFVALILLPRPISLPSN